MTGIGTLRNSIRYLISYCIYFVFPETIESSEHDSESDSDDEVSIGKRKGQKESGIKLHPCILVIIPSKIIFFAVDWNQPVWSLCLSVCIQNTGNYML